MKLRRDRLPTSSPPPDGRHRRGAPAVHPARPSSALRPAPRRPDLAARPRHLADVLRGYLRHDRLRPTRHRLPVRQHPRQRHRHRAGQGVPGSGRPAGRAPDHPLRQLMRFPNRAQSEAEFLNTIAKIAAVAGFVVCWKVRGPPAARSNCNRSAAIG